MSANDVRKTLRNETGLLGALVGKAKSYDGQSFFTKQGTFIQQSWATYLANRAATNDDLADADNYDDAALKHALVEERDQLEKYIQVHDRKNEGLDEWITFIECERDILNYLIRQI